MKFGVLFLLAVPAVIACDTTTDTGDFVGTPSIRIAGTWAYNFNRVRRRQLGVLH